MLGPIFFFYSKFGDNFFFFSPVGKGSCWVKINELDFGQFPFLFPWA